MDAVFHLAGQVAVTTSVSDPREDFESNALGTLNVLEAMRKAGSRALMVYSSTNKVYGAMSSAAVEERGTRYAYRDLIEGIAESAPLDFHSPYGCSKGAADQYVHDYARIYGMPTTVLRQSCIYGPRQFGVEDQGWLAWFMIAALLGRPITIYGNGKQVRDVLHVDDLVDAYFLAVERRNTVSGEVYNAGGGPDCAVSIWAEFGPMLEDLLGRPIPVSYGPFRPGDQPCYISDIRKIQRDLGWRPQIDVEDGIRRLFEWVCANKGMLEAF
jgi:CDP-paratose 2-epimerase